MQKFLINTLDQHFRPTKPVNASLFPRHEFDEDEAIQLKSFCDILYAEGYEAVFQQYESSKMRDILDLSSEYGCFVEKEASPWYLGVFIMAECLMEPYASDSFSDEMVRSNVFAAASSEYKNAALWLMLMAFFCNRVDSTPSRVEAYMETLPIERFLELSLPKEGDN
jgi:hypothetical protein